MDSDHDFLDQFGGDEETIALAPGSNLFEKGDPARLMYVVRSGAVEVYDAEIVFETVMPGGLLGEMAIVDGAPRSASARAKVASEVIPVDQRRFLAMVLRTPFFAIRIMRMLTRRLRHSNAAAQQAKQRSNQRFRIIAQSLADAVWDRNLVDNTIWWSEGMTTKFGHEAGTHREGVQRWRGLIHPEDRERVVASLAAAIDGSKAQWTEEYRFTRADGTCALIIDRGSVIRDDDGKAIRMAGSMVDVTEQRMLEEQLRQSQKMEAVGQLTGGVAHDFNNMLMAILANVDMVLESGGIAPSVAEHLERIAGAAQRASNLTRRLLAFSRKQVLQAQETNLNDLVAVTAELMRQTLGKQIAVKLVLADDLWLTNVDRAQIDSALVNLSVNARDAMPGGGRLRIETRNATFDESYVARNPDATAGDYVMLSVADSGSGMPPEVVERVFEPFFTTKGAGKGTGLGLSMVFGFIKQSNGHIKIDSEVGRGTEVKLYLPRCLPAAKMETAPANTSLQGGKERILVVDDEELVRLVVAQQLISLGYAVTEAADGSAGLEALKSGKSYDLLLTDVQMPEPVTGKSLATAAAGLCPGIRVVFMSAYAGGMIANTDPLDPKITLLTKPFQKADLARTVRGVLDGAAAS